MSPRVTLERASGWFDGAVVVASPNFDARPRGATVELAVVHAISLPPGQFGGGYIESFFQNRLDPACHPYFRSIEDLKVSSHFLVDRAGRLKQFVSTHFRAWHCGESSFEGRTACNDFSIGIELEGCDERPFSAAQYEMLTAVLAELAANYPLLTHDRIVGHCDIAPARKTDPGPHFDWDMMHDLLGEKLRLQRIGESQ